MCSKEILEWQFAFGLSRGVCKAFKPQYNVHYNNFSETNMTSVGTFPNHKAHVLYNKVKCELLWKQKRRPLLLQKLFESFKMSTHMIG